MSCTLQSLSMQRWWLTARLQASPVSQHTEIQMPSTGNSSKKIFSRTLLQRLCWEKIRGQSYDVFVCVSKPGEVIVMLLFYMRLFMDSAYEGKREGTGFFLPFFSMCGFLCSCCYLSLLVVVPYSISSSSDNQPVSLLSLSCKTCQISQYLCSIRLSEFTTSVRKHVKTGLLFFSLG